TTHPYTPHISTLSLHDALPIFTFQAPTWFMTSCTFAAGTRSPGCSMVFLCRTPISHRTSARSSIPRTSTTWKYSVAATRPNTERSEEHTSELQSRGHLVCRLLL